MSQLAANRSCCLLQLGEGEFWRVGGLQAHSVLVRLPPKACECANRSSAAHFPPHIEDEETDHSCRKCRYFAQKIQRIVWVKTIHLSRFDEPFRI